MAKKTVKKYNEVTPRTKKEDATPVATLSPLEQSKPFSLTDFRMQAIILIILGFLFYANSFSNEYAFDDGIVVQKNEYVQNGFSGIRKILSTDAYDSFYRQGNAKQQFSGGRYRPLSIITFAIEQQLFGSNAKDKPENDLASLRHVVNVVLYIFSVILLLYFLSTYVFKKNPLTAFIAALLFLIHPLHTEVVANIKSRDEIMSFLFILLTFISVFRYRESKKKSQLLYGLLYYFLALLSKEYAITLMMFIPMLLYIVKRDSLQKSISFTLPYLLVVAAYLAVRFSAIGIGTTKENTDVLNNPYMFATTPEKWATKIEILIYYLRFLFFPKPLSFDYSYNTIPYVNFGNGLVWLSLLIHLSMIAATIILFLKKNILSFALAFYLLHLMLVSNFILDVGATMGERLVYHSSFGLVIILAVLITRFSELITQPKTRKITLAVLGILITSWCGARVIERNPEWKNDDVLYLTDAPKVPNSALANGNAGMIYYNQSCDTVNKSRENELLQKALYHLKKSVAIHKTYVNGYINLSVTYMRLKEYDHAKESLDIARRIYPSNSIIKTNYTALGVYYFNDAMIIGAKQPHEAVKLLEKATEADPDNVNYWYNLGGAAYTVHDNEKARMAWTKTLELNPGHKEAKAGMAALNAAVQK